MIVIALLLAMSATSNIDTPRAGLDFNPIRIIKRAWEASDFVPVIQGFVLGNEIALAALRSINTLVGNSIQINHLGM